MRVLVNDGMEIEGIEILVNSGLEVDTLKKSPLGLVSEISKYDALTVRSATKVDEEVIKAGASGILKIIGRAGVGIDNIDIGAANKYGILVKSAPNGNTNSTAELALGLMLSLARKIPQADKQLKEGVWAKKRLKGTELSYKTLGIIGCGRIGRRLAEISRGFGMKVIGYDPVKSTDTFIEYLNKDDVIRNSDYLSIHTGGKELIIGKRELGMMKPNAYLINASRGDNVDYTALYNALKNNVIAGAGIDVFPDEPKKEGSEFASNLRGLENVVLTSHLGASTKEAQIKTSTEMATVIRDYLLRGSFAGAVNAGEKIESEEKELYRLFVHHKDVPGAFAEIDSVLASEGINIRENQSREIGKEGAAITVYLMHSPPSEEVLAKLREKDVIYRVNA